MKPILKIKIAVDAAMSVSMLLLMAYGLVGEAAHEWIGMGMFALFVAHHILNHRWIQAVPRGRYTPLRVVQTALAGLIFLCMVGSMISGIVLSRHVFAFLPRHGGYELAQQVHILCAYWGFVCMSLHLGFHWSMMLAMARKHLQPSSMRIWSLRLIGWLWAVYGAFAFRRRGVSLYLLLRSHFVFYDYSEPVIPDRLSLCNGDVCADWISYINAVEMAAHFLFTLSVIKRCNFRPIIWRRLQRFFIFKLLLLQFAYAPAKKMRDFKGNIPLTLGFQ